MERKNILFIKPIENGLDVFSDAFKQERRRSRKIIPKLPDRFIGFNELFKARFRFCAVMLYVCLISEQKKLPQMT
jgi:hypothetical protein